MPEQKHRIRLKSSWRGKIDSTDPECEEKQYEAGDVIDVDVKTCNALVFIHLKAELVTLEEIEATVREEVQGPGTQRKRASKTTKK